MSGLRTALGWSGIAIIAIAMGCGSQEGSPDDPKMAVEAVVRGINIHRPDAVWDAMPERYRQDVETLVRSLGDQVDRSNYDRAFVVMGKLAALVNDKRSRFFASKFLGPFMALDGFAAKWEAFGRFFERASKCEISRVESLEDLDPEAFLRGTGRDLMRDFSVATSMLPGGNPFDWFDGMTIEQVREAEDIVTLRLNSPAHGFLHLHVTRVDGFWVPVDMSTKWTRIVNGLRTRVVTMSLGRARLTKMETAQSLSKLERHIEELRRADTQAVFDARLAEALSWLSSGRIGGPLPPAAMPR